MPVTFNPGTEFDNKNFAQAVITLIQPIDFVEGLLEMPSDLVREFAIKQAEGNQFYFYAYKKADRADGNAGAIEWDMKTLSNIGLDSLELAARTITIDREIVAGYQIATTKLQSKGGQTVKILEATMISVRNDLQKAIYSRVKTAFQNSLNVTELADNKIETLVQWMQDVYDTAIYAQLLREYDKTGWFYYIKRSKFNEIFGLNGTFTAANSVPGGINNTMLQGMVWGLTPTDGISFNGIKFKIIEDENFRIDVPPVNGYLNQPKNRDSYDMYFANTSQWGNIVYVNDGSQGGVWTEPINTGMKDRMTAIKGAATVEAIPNLYVWNKDTDGNATDPSALDKSPFAYGCLIKKQTP